MTRRILQLAALTAMLFMPAPAAVFTVQPLTIGDVFSANVADGIRGENEAVVNDALFVGGDVFLQAVQTYETGFASYISRSVLDVFSYVSPVEDESTTVSIAGLAPVESSPTALDLSVSAPKQVYQSSAPATVRAESIATPEIPLIEVNDIILSPEPESGVLFLLSALLLTMTLYLPYFRVRR